MIELCGRRNTFLVRIRHQIHAGCSTIIAVCDYSFSVLTFSPLASLRLVVGGVEEGARPATGAPVATTVFCSGASGSPWCGKFSAFSEGRDDGEKAGGVTELVPPCPWSIALPEVSTGDEATAAERSTLPLRCTLRLLWRGRLRLVDLRGAAVWSVPVEDFALGNPGSKSSGRCSEALTRPGPAAVLSAGELVLRATPVSGSLGGAAPSELLEGAWRLAALVEGGALAAGRSILRANLSFSG